MTENGKVNKSFSIDTENRFLFVTAISQIVFFYIYFFIFIFTSIDGIQSMNQNQNFSISFSFTVLWPFKKNVVRELNKSNASMKIKYGHVDTQRYQTFQIGWKERDKSKP